MGVLDFNDQSNVTTLEMLVFIQLFCKRHKDYIFYFCSFFFTAEAIGYVCHGVEIVLDIETRD